MGEVSFQGTVQDVSLILQEHMHIDAPSAERTATVLYCMANVEHLPHLPGEQIEAEEIAYQALVPNSYFNVNLKRAFLNLIFEVVTFLEPSTPQALVRLAVQFCLLVKLNVFYTGPEHYCALRKLLIYRHTKGAYISIDQIRAALFAPRCDLSLPGDDNCPNRREEACSLSEKAFEFSLAKLREKGLIRQVGEQQYLIEM